MKIRTIILMSILILLITSRILTQETDPIGCEIFFDINEPFTGSLPEIGRDEIDDIKWVHSTEEGGLIPLDICYASSANRLFVYGDRRISIIDATTEEIINTIDASEYGHWKYFARTFLNE